jgi:hypothetical protein
LLQELCGRCRHNRQSGDGTREASPAMPDLLRKQPFAVRHRCPKMEHPDDSQITSLSHIII